MTRLERSSLLPLMSLALIACQPKHPSFDAPTVPQTVAPGSVLVLTEPLWISPGQASLYFQNGHRVDRPNLHVDSPYCRWATGAAVGKANEIPPQEFRVQDLTYDDQGEGSAGEQASITRLTLKSQTNATLTPMACQWSKNSRHTDFLTPEQIAAALGGTFSIEEPGEAGP